MAGDFWQKLRRLFTPTQPRQPRAPQQRPAPQRQTQPRQPVSVPSQQVQPQPTQPQQGPLTGQEILQLIAEAGRNRKMLEIKYDGVDRLVEPYSMRDKGYGPVFFGFCSIHDRIHSFKLEKIQEIKISDFTFAPKWDVEF